MVAGVMLCMSCSRCTLKTTCEQTAQAQTTLANSRKSRRRFKRRKAESLEAAGQAGYSSGGGGALGIASGAGAPCTARMSSLGNLALARVMPARSSRVLLLHTACEQRRCALLWFFLHTTKGQHDALSTVRQLEESRNAHARRHCQRRRCWTDWEGQQRGRRALHLSEL